MIITKNSLFAISDSSIKNFKGSNFGLYSSLQTGNKKFNLLNPSIVFSNEKFNSTIAFTVGKIDDNLFFTINNLNFKLKNQPIITDIDSSLLTKQKDSLDGVKRRIEIQAKVLKFSNSLDSFGNNDSVQNLKDSLVSELKRINSELTLIQNKFEEAKTINNRTSNRIEFGNSPFNSTNLRNGIGNPKYGFIKSFDFGNYTLQTFSGITGNVLRYQFHKNLRTLYLTLGQKLTSTKLKGIYIQHEVFFNVYERLNWELSEISLGRLWFSKIFGNTDIKLTRFIDPHYKSKSKTGLFVQNNYYFKKYSRDLLFETRPVQRYYSDFTLKERIIFNLKNIFLVNKKFS